MSAPALNRDRMADLYDTEFLYYVNLSKGLIENFKDQNDRRICVNWIRKLCQLENSDIEVKCNRNSFFKYLLQTLKTLQNPKWLESQVLEPREDKSQFKSEQAVISHWSQDKRTYIAVKPLPGQGALIYMAVAKDTKMGWDNVGKK